MMKPGSECWVRAKFFSTEKEHGVVGITTVNESKDKHIVAHVPLASICNYGNEGEKDNAKPNHNKIMLIRRAGGWHWYAEWTMHENELSVTYKLFKQYGRGSEPEEAGEGYVKCDGCSNWDVGGHFCSQRECYEQGIAISLCWQHASDVIEGWCHEDDPPFNLDSKYEYTDFPEEPASTNES